MQKLNLEFTAGQVMKSLWLNLISQKTDEIVDEVNKLPQMAAAMATNKLEIDALKEKEVNIKQSVFDEMLAAGTLDPTKTYNTYEE